MERFSTTLQAGGEAAPAVLAALKATESFATDAAISPLAATRLGIIVEELVSNALRHGAGCSSVSFELTRTDGEIRLDLADDGDPFDPTADRAFAGPDPESGGGVGLALVKAWASDVVYRRDSNFNYLRLRMPASG